MWHALMLRYKKRHGVRERNEGGKRREESENVSHTLTIGDIKGDFFFKLDNSM